MRARGPRILILAAASFAGLLSAHALDYWLLARDPIVRIGLLLRSGHSYLSRAPEFVVASIVVAAVGALAVGFRGKAVAASVVRSAVTLAMIQAGAFVALEASERIVAHASAERMVQLTLVGVALQIVVAGVAAIALRVLARLGGRLAVMLAVRRAPARAPLRARAFVRTREVRSLFMGTLVRGRAPPRSIAA